MRPVTDSFKNTVRGAHKAIFRARVLVPGLVGVNPGPIQQDGDPFPGEPESSIPIISGDVQFDTRTDVNGTLDLVTYFDWPGRTGGLGTPYGQEIFVERGVQYENGVREYVGLGYFRIDSVEQENAPTGALRITGSDRMSNVRDGRAISPVQFGPTASVGAVLDAVVGAVVPNLVSVYDFDAYSTVLGSDHFLDQDRMKFVQELVAAYGKVAYFDYAGRFQVKNSPDTSQPAVYLVNSGRNGVLVSMSRSISRDSVYNGVVATGEPTGSTQPVRGVALDLDPNSPTYWNGAFGKVPRFFSSPFMTTDVQCAAAALSLLRSTTGLPYSVSLGMVPDPSVEGWDVIRIKYDEKSNQETHIVDAVSYGLAVEGPMRINTRKQYLT